MKNSDGDCDLKIPLADGDTLRIYDKRCDSRLDSIAKVSVEEKFYFHHDREELTAETQQELDTLLQEAEQQLRSLQILQRF